MSAPEPFADELLGRIEDDDETVTADAVVAAIEAHPEEEEELEEVLETLDDDAPEVLAEVADRLETLLDHEDPMVQSTAAGLIGTLVACESVDVDRFVPRLEALLAETDDEFLIPGGVLEAFVAIGWEDPSMIEPAVPTIATALRGETEFVQELAVRLLDSVAAESPESVSDHVPAMLECARGMQERLDEAQNADINDDLPTEMRAQRQRESGQRERVQRLVAGTLLEIAESDPDELDDVVPEIVETVAVIESDPIRGDFLDALLAVVETNPRLIDGHQSTLADVASDASSNETRVTAVRLLGLAAGQNPARTLDAVRPILPSVRELLAAEEPDARSAAAGLLGYLAETDPETVEPTRERLFQLLDDESPLVRGNAAWALATLGGTEVESALDELRSGDPVPFVREAANDALAQLDSTG